MVSGLQVRDSSDFHREQRAFEAVKSLFMLARTCQPPRKSSGTRTDLSVAIGFVNSLN
ncbi:hypothetical protein M595_5228 [Lyngbya aestuarii BL J]|uniref:Uncharacterized protein n=1 Tax=Lyngbya aestuarii BL J TaxID=1348334 RepID=U7QC66_9CYAN|nr:hypothetical protein M595_5228 [Lyngbya aestuarii BL J]